MGSYQCTEAHLEGYEGPYFPLALEEIMNQLGAVKPPTREWLLDVCRAVEGFTGRVIRPTTSDGYVWFWGLEFTVYSDSSLLILIPWTNGRWPQLSDRSIAMHSRNVDQDAARQVVGNLIEAIKDHRRISQWGSKVTSEMFLLRCVKTGDGPWVEVTREEWMRLERQHGLDGNGAWAFSDDSGGEQFRGQTIDLRHFNPNHYSGEPGLCDLAERTRRSRRLV